MTLIEKLEALLERAKQEECDPLTISHLKTALIHQRIAESTDAPEEIPHE